MAYIGIRNSSIAMMGPPRSSIMPRMLGLMVAMAQVVQDQKIAVTLLSCLTSTFLPFSRRDLAIRPFMPLRP